MRLKYCHHREIYEPPVAASKLTSPSLPVHHGDTNFYIPLTGSSDANASHLRICHNNSVYATLRYFDEPIDMLNGRTLADVKAIFQSGLGKYYFKAGDYFDITFPTQITTQGSPIPANSTWRVVCLGIDHNAEIEGYNRGHFCIGRNTDNVEIAFLGREMNYAPTNAGGWGGSELRAWLNSTFYNALPADLKAVIAPCDKYTDNVGYNTAGGYYAENMSITSDNIWLISQYEVGFGALNPGEAVLLKQYDYYLNGSSKIRYQHDDASTAVIWWLRSPGGDSRQFRVVNANGGSSNRSCRYNGTGIAPCFTIA